MSHEQMKECSPAIDCIKNSLERYEKTIDNARK